MKKILIIFFMFIFSIFALPILFTQRNVAEISKEENILPEEVALKEYNYKQYNTIKVLHTSTNEIEELPLDEYLLGVVSAEMPASYHQEALNAQAIVARTYTIYTITHNNGKHGEADICDDSSCCQAWISKEDRLAKWEESERNENWNKITLAINNTSGKIITYNGEVIDAFFHSNSGGTTEIPVNVWGGNDYPYLQSVETAGEDAYSQYSSELTFSKEELNSKMKEKYSDFDINYDEENCIQIVEYTESGRVKTIKIGNVNLSGVEARTLLGLKSTNFEVIWEGNNVKFSVKGYGHGVGMSQTGADSMANLGSTYEEIIKHFYTGVEIKEY